MESPGANVTEFVTEPFLLEGMQKRVKKERGKVGMIKRSVNGLTIARI